MVAALAANLDPNAAAAGQRVDFEPKPAALKTEGLSGHDSRCVEVCRADPGDAVTPPGGRPDLRVVAPVALLVMNAWPRLEVNAVLRLSAQEGSRGEDQPRIEGSLRQTDFWEQGPF